MTTTHKPETASQLINGTLASLSPDQRDSAVNVLVGYLAGSVDRATLVAALDYAVNDARQVRP